MPVGKAVHRDSRSVRRGNVSLRDAHLQFGEGDQLARERASRHTGGAPLPHLAPAGPRPPPRAGLASHTWPGPERPGKLRLIALTVTCPASVEEPGPQLAQAPQPGI